MTNSTIKLPYFDLIFRLLDKGNPTLDLAFGRHVHWGYWAYPQKALNTPEDYSNAAEQLTREVYAAANVDNGYSVLDVGCGFGGTIASLNENYSGMNLVGLNIDSRQLERARQKVVAQNDNSIRFEEGNAIALPFADQSFDVVLAVECIFHFPIADSFSRGFSGTETWWKISLIGFYSFRLVLPPLWFTPNIQDPGFYGYFDLRYTASRYQKLADEIGFNGLLERDITVNTLPTYDFLWSLKQDVMTSDLSAPLSTWLIEWLSRLALLRYMILAYVKA